MPDQPELSRDLVLQIKSAILKCERVPDVNTVAVDFMAHVYAMENSGDRYFRTMAIQIKNLAAYQRKCIEKGWIK